MDSNVSEWGWLVRFVHPNQYDKCEIEMNEVEDERVLKSYYQTFVENASEVSDFEAETFPNANFYGNYNIFEDEQENEYEQEYENESENYLNDHVLRGFIPQIGPSFAAAQLLPLNNNEFHLAEGIGDDQDTWPEYSDNDGPEEFSDYTDESDFDSETFNDDYDDEILGSVNEDDEQGMLLSENENILNVPLENENSRNFRIIETILSDNSDSSSSSSSSFLDTDSNSIVTSELIDHFDTTSFKILFKNMEGNSLFLDDENYNNSDSDTDTDHFKSCPYDIFYCTASSLFIVNSFGKVKSHCPSVSQNCLKSQRSEALELNIDQILRNRLSMGEWVPELGIFLVINCSGHLLVNIPKSKSTSTDSSITTRSIIIPDKSFSTPIIGFTVIRKWDEEFGVKVHVYIICFDGNIRLYEICKTDFVNE